MKHALVAVVAIWLVACGGNQAEPGETTSPIATTATEVGPVTYPPAPPTSTVTTTTTSAVPSTTAPDEGTPSESIRITETVTILITDPDG